jgi:hypothetical protein
MKLVCEYLPASPVGEQAVEDPSLLRGQGGGEKLVTLLSQWQAAYPYFSLVRAASQSQWQAAYPYFSLVRAASQAQWQAA